MMHSVSNIDIMVLCDTLRSLSLAFRLNFLQIAVEFLRYQFMTFLLNISDIKATCIMLNITYHCAAKQPLLSPLL